MRFLKKAVSFIVTLAMVMSIISMTGITAVYAAKKVKVTSVTVPDKSLTLTVGDTYTVKPTVAPSNATNKKVKYTSSKKTVATVTSKGKITAKKAGTAKITVKAADGSGKKATVTVKVVKKAAASVAASTVESSEEAQSESSEEPASQEESKEEASKVEETTTDEKSSKESSSVVESSKEEKQEEVAYPKASFSEEAKNSDVSVAVKAPAGALPEGTTMNVTNVDKSKVEEAVTKVVEGEVIDMETVDISFENAEGKEIEPEKKVEVELTSEKITEDSNISIVHIDDNGKAELIEDITVDTEKHTVTFKAASFSTYTISWGYRSYNIHYVDTNGNSLTPTITPTFTNNYMFLIYDIEGYEYDSTHYSSRTGTACTPLLRTNNGDRQYYRDGWRDLRDDIYVVYKKKTAPTQGGTPVIEEISPEDWPQDPETPKFHKTSTNNSDGTNTVSLSISGGEKDVENQTKANVIVVFDVSGSMSYNMSGSQTSNVPSAQQRITIAKNAVNEMANILLNGNLRGIKMALVSFSTSAQQVQGFTDNYTTYRNAVNGLSANGGTNWEKALSLANRMTVDSDAATYVVFVTDGDPTFRQSRGKVADANLDMYWGTNNNNNYPAYRSDQIFGTGTTDPNSLNFNFSVDEVKSIVQNNKTFYSIGVSSDVTKVKTLTTNGGAPADNAFLATNEAALKEAFSSITQSIKTTLGFGDVAITDGITELSNVEMKVMQEVDPDSFTYYKVTSSGQTEWNPASENCGLASYNSETGAVVWNMGEKFQLEEGVTYMVTFRVWPSQDAYDLVADLNNGVKVYEAGHDNSITADEREQVVEIKAPTSTEQGSYALKTNTDSVSATYSQTSSTGETVTVSGETGLTADYEPGTMQNMSLTSQLLTVKKVFEDDLTAGSDRQPEVKLTLLRKVNDNNHEFAEYNKPGTTSPIITLNDDNNWEYSFYVAPGFEVDGEILEKGYVFTVVEPEIDYHYDLIEEDINPMVIDGTLTLIGDMDANKALTAINRVKSGIDISKKVIDKNNNEIEPDTEFTIKGKLLGPDGNPYTFNMAWDDRPDKSVTTGGGANWELHQNDPIAYHKWDKDGNYIIRKGHVASTDNIELTLKVGESIRFINVPEGVTFEFDEGTMPDNYEWNKTEAVTQHRTAPNGPFVTDGDVQPTIDGHKAKLTTGVVGNKQYVITFTNKQLQSDDYFYVYHSSDNTIEKIATDDARVNATYDASTKSYTYEFNIVNETKKGYIYGGYYKAYKKAGMTADQIVAATYNTSVTNVTTYDGTHAANTNWTKDSSGKAYDGSVMSWQNKNALTESGLSMGPKAGTVYYLKEVPDQYVRPATYYVYDDFSENKDVIHMYFLTPVDDGLYLHVSAKGNTDIEATKKLYSEFKVTEADGSETTYDVPKTNSNLKAGYLAVWSVDNLLVKNKTYDVTPYILTKDNLVSTSVKKRTIKTSDLTKDNMDITDSDVTPTVTEYQE